MVDAGRPARMMLHPQSVRPHSLSKTAADRFTNSHTATINSRPSLQTKELRGSVTGRKCLAFYETRYITRINEL